MAKEGPILPQESCVVVCADIDSFFVQAEQLRNPSLAGKAVAVQQHQDIIAVNPAAKAAGVTKHCLPSEARSLLTSVGGKVVHVNVDHGYRVSYKPYRELSRQFFKVLESIPLVQVVDKASIDEAFLLCHDVGQGPESGAPVPLELGRDVADAIRRKAMTDLGLAVSVGVARNCLVAKLAATAAKPDGVRVVDTPDVHELLEAMPVTRLPGYGGRVAQQLQQHGMHTIAQVQQLSLDGVCTLLQLQGPAAERLLDYAHGRDFRVPSVRAPARTLSLQMTLTPVPVPVHPDWKGRSATGERNGMLQPLMIHAQDAAKRMQGLIETMMQDLLERVELGCEDHNRWPTELTLRVVTHGPAARTFTRHARFPPVPAPARSTALGTHSTEPCTPRDRPPTIDIDCPVEGTAGPAALTGTVRILVDSAESMFMDIVASCEVNAPVTQVHVCCGKFVSTSSARNQRLTDCFGKADAVSCVSHPPRACSSATNTSKIGNSTSRLCAERVSEAMGANEADGRVSRQADAHDPEPARDVGSDSEASLILDEVDIRHAAVHQSDALVEDQPLLPPDAASRLGLVQANHPQDAVSGRVTVEPACGSARPDVCVGDGAGVGEPFVTWSLLVDFAAGGGASPHDLEALSLGILADLNQKAPESS